MSDYLKTIFTNLYYCFTEDPSFDVSANILHDEEVEGQELPENWDTIDPEIIQRRLEERRKMEEADHELTNELFDENYVKPTSEPLQPQPPPPPPKKEQKKIKIDIKLINHSYMKNPETRKNTIKEWRRRKEVFGEAEFDEIDEMSDDIHEKHGDNV
jgi:hypothetical protein